MWRNAQMQSSEQDELTPAAPGRRELSSADWLAGLPVIDRLGHPVGELVHVMLDVPRGSIAFAALSGETIPGASGQLVAVPWPLLTFDADRRMFTLACEVSRLQQAPRWPRDEW